MGVSERSGLVRQRATARGGLWPTGFLLLVSALLVAAPAVAQDDDEAHWFALKQMFFGERTLHDGAGVISLEAPYRAHDAAVVPITINARFPSLRSATSSRSQSS